MYRAAEVALCVPHILTTHTNIFLLTSSIQNFKDYRLIIHGLKHVIKSHRMSIGCRKSKVRFTGTVKRTKFFLYMFSIVGSSATGSRTNERKVEEAERSGGVTITGVERERNLPTAGEGIE
jgi:hypothetical protein